MENIALIDSFSEFKDIKSDLDFVNMLLAEENVSVFHSEPLYKPNYLRLAVLVPVDLLEEGCKRIKEFAIRHLK